ncbi:MAG: DUF4256 domain-containing protein [Archangium sp.]|nr:DUF4256 domain-containing protein [Archangium sp.]
MAARKKNDSLLSTLQERFEKNEKRHPGLKWDAVAKKLEKVLAVVAEMESTGGEPDVVELNGVLVCVDCSAETPKDRRSICYDGEALRSRKENKPKTSALELAKKLGVEVLDEAQYAALQKVGPFDEKTSSWILTPPEVRKLGGALFGDHRFGRTFTYHNGAESYYAARGFRGFVRL